jgi:hypothetical protein
MHLMYPECSTITVAGITAHMNVFHHWNIDGCIDVTTLD